MTKEQEKAYEKYESRFKNAALDKFWRESLYILDQYIAIPTQSEIDARCIELRDANGELSDKDAKNQAIGELTFYRSEDIYDQITGDQLITLVASIRLLPIDLPDDVATKFVDAALPFAKAINRGDFLMSHLMPKHTELFDELVSSFGEYGFQRIHRTSE